MQANSMYMRNEDEGRGTRIGCLILLCNSKYLVALKGFYNFINQSYY